MNQSTPYQTQQSELSTGCQPDFTRVHWEIINECGYKEAMLYGLIEQSVQCRGATTTSAAALAAEYGTSEKTARKWLRRLADAGWVTLTRTDGGYRFSLDRKPR